ncbi:MULTISPECIES: hypothetical protein [Streptomyces]|uniref:hypothetical protein n=1 Tax=Streptomyces TaxID=1883 RepID=UPI00209DC225|nr:hypothetical protein [Streptomyces sp. RKCA744]MCO8308389.1 hypothetical protein [Streptomyces sp. RKCA744]
MPTSPIDPPDRSGPGARIQLATPDGVGCRQLGAGEAAVMVAAITAVTVLAVLQRPIPAVLTALVAAACLLLVPRRAVRLLTALLGVP